MSLQRRYFLLTVTLATVAATPAFGQVAPTVGAANSGKQGAAVPDFSGVWTHSIPGFEPLASGPTALVNRSRRQNGTGNNLQLVGDYTNPILKPRAAEVVKKHGEIALKGIGDPTPRNQCWPGGVPLAAFSTNQFHPPGGIAHIRQGCGPWRREDAFILARRAGRSPGSRGAAPARCE